MNMRSLVMSVALFTSAISAAIGEAFVPVSADPLLVWNYGSMAVSLSIPPFPISRPPPLIVTYFTFLDTYLLTFGIGHLVHRRLPLLAHVPQAGSGGGSPQHAARRPSGRVEGYRG